MGFSYLELVNRILSMGQQSPITSIQTDSSTWGYKAQVAVNDALKDLALRLKIKTRQVEFQFNTVVGQQYYCVPKRIQYPFITLRLEGALGSIINTPPNDIDNMITESVETGDPAYYYLAGYSGVLGQPSSSGEKLKVYSSSGSDTSIVVIQGYDAYDNYMSEEITLSGTSTVTSTYEFKFVDSISKGVTEGTITIKNNAEDFTLLQMSRKETNVRYPVIALSSVPETVKTIYGRSYLIIPDLVNELDVPLGLSDLATPAIVATSYARFLEYDPKITTWNRASAWQLAEKEITALVANDKQEGIQYRMKPPVCSRPMRQYFRPLDRGSY